MGDECPPLFAWSALRVADAGAGTALLTDLFPGLMRLYDYWWRAEAVQPRGLFTCGFCGMDNLPRGDRTAQADASGWMAMFARDLATIADRLGRADDAARLRTDRDSIAAAINANLWSEERSFYFDLDDDGTFIPTRSYAGLVPLIAGVVPPDRQARVLAALRDPGAFLSPHGVRSVTADSVLYEPGYARAKGTNSNWRGPVWMPLNYLLVEALGDVEPQLAAAIRERVVGTVEADWTATGHFHEYFDAESGEGIGADAQTGWTALVANLIAQGWPSAASR
jgi:glycogen debranching enzyme